MDAGEYIYRSYAQAATITGNLPLSISAVQYFSGVIGTKNKSQVIITNATNLSAIGVKRDGTVTFLGTTSPINVANYDLVFITMAKSSMFSTSISIA